MRYVSLCSAIFVAMILLAAPTTVNAAGWCLLSSGRSGGSTLCRFRTFEQCLASRSESGDTCIQDNFTDQQAAPPRSRKASGTEQRKKAAPDTAAKPQPRPAKPREQPAKQAVPAQTPAAPTPTSQAAAQYPARNFTAARDLVLAGRYEAGIKAMHALGFDKHPDVAAYIGLAHNKLGRAAEAKSWYETALAGAPNHLLTLSYYGMLRAEQGDLAAAQEDLEKIKRICAGTGCKEYIALDGVIASKRR